MAGQGQRTLEVRFVGDASQLQQTFNQVDKGGGKLKDSIGKLGAAVGAAFGASMAADMALGADEATSKLRAQLGITKADGKRLGKVAGDVYADAWGDSTDEVNEALRSIGTSLMDVSKTSDAELKKTSTRLLAITSAFGVESGEVAKTAGNLVRTGLAPNLERAFDLITKGFQAGADEGGEFLDTLNEYSEPLKSLGLDARDFTAMLAKGSKMGVWSVDKIGDAFKEFSIRAVDGSETTQQAFKTLGLDADKMAAAIAAGGPSAKRATSTILQGLQKIKDPVKREAAGVALFGSMWEDLGGRIITSLDPTVSTLGKVKGATDEMAAALGDNAKAKLEAFKRQALMGLAQVASAVLIPALYAIVSAIQGVVGVVSSVVGWFDRHRTTAYALAAAAGTVATAMVALRVASLVPMIPTLVAVSKAWLVTNAAMLANPVVLVVAGLAALAAGLVVAYEKVGWFRDAVNAAWSALKGAVEVVFPAISGAITTAWNAVRDATVAVWNALKPYLTVLWNAVKTAVGIYFTAYKTIIVGVWNAVSTITKTTWNVLKTVVTGVWSALKTAVTTYFGAYKTIITGVWTGISTATTTAWNTAKSFLTGSWDSIKTVASSTWNGIKTAITKPVGSAIDWVKDAIGHGGKGAKGLVGWLSGAWDTITKGVGSFAGEVKKGVEGAFKGVVGTVLKFAIKILEVVGKIPGVGFEGQIKDLKGAGKSMGIPGFARGGVMEAGGPGGRITRPLAVVGEEAPRHEEYIVPTNPAYRGRALGLFGSLGAKLGVPGFAKGGVLGYDALKNLAASVGAPNPGLMAAVAMAESGGDVDVIGPPSGRGLWQIEWNVWAQHMAKLGLTNPNDPMQNARMMMEVLREQGINAWVAYNNGSYRKFLNGANDNGGGGGLLGKIGGALGQLFSKGAGWITDQLPGADSLPGWIQGLGKEVLGGVTGWVKKKVESLLGMGGGGKLGDGNPMWAAIDAMASQFKLQVTSFMRPGDSDSLHSLGRAKDYSNSSGPTPQMMAFANAVAARFGSKLEELIYTPLGWSIDKGRRVAPYAQADHLDHVHVGLARGGVVRVGENGPEDAWLPDGTRVRNASDTAHRDRRDGPLIGEVNITHGADEHEIARQLAWLVS